MTSHALTMALLTFFPALMAFAAASDLLTMTIPNRACLALALGYGVLALALGVPVSVVGVNATCGAFVLMLTFALFQMGWIGGGDAKLAAATALWVGWGSLLDYGLYASMLGGALTLLILALRRAGLLGLLARFAWIARIADPKTGIPYGIALAAAGLLVYPQTQIWRALAQI